MNIGVLVSGRGSNLEAILNQIERGAIKGASVKIVLSNDPEARALKVAARHGVKALALEQRDSTREAYGEKIADALSRNGVKQGDGLVLLAGFMKILPSKFVEKYRGRILNIHPSLLPAFPGVNAQYQALSYGVKVSGCTVHFVVPEVDAGPIVLQRVVPVKEGDDERALAARILRQEHIAYPKAVKLFVEGRLSLTGRRVTVRN